MENKKDGVRPDNARPVGAWKSQADRLVNSTGFSYTFMVSILVYILLCGYFMVFAGSLFIEAILQGWYRADATETDATSFLLGYLYGFPSLLGVAGGIAVMSTSPRTWFRFKVLLFVPAAVWATLLVLDLLRHPLYWSQFIYHIPAMLLCLFVLFGVMKKTPIPYMNTTGSK